MKRTILLFFFNCVLFHLSMAQELAVPKIIVSIDSTENHLIFVLSDTDPQEVKLRSESCGHYYYEPLDYSIRELFICTRDPNRSSYFSIGDTINNFIKSTLPNSMDITYTYIGFGEYLKSYPDMHLFFCNDSVLFANDYYTDFYTLSITDKIGIDSYLIYLWLHHGSTAYTYFRCYKDWFNYIINHTQEVYLTERDNKHIRTYFPNGELNNEIEYSSDIKTLTIYETTDKCLVKLTKGNSSIICFIDNFWIKKNE